MKVGDLVKLFDWVGLVTKEHMFGRVTILWSCGTLQDVNESNVQIEVIG